MTSEQTVDIDINYEDYSSPTEVYNVNDNRSGIPPRFVSSPTKDGSSALRLEFGDGQKAANVEYRFPEHDYGMPREVYTRFWLYPDNFEVPDGGTVRVFWLPLTNGSGSSGGGDTDGTNGFSNAIGFANRNDSPAPDGYNFFSYIYHLDRSSTSGDFVMTDEPVWMDQWNLIEGYVRVNTFQNGVANPDGVMRYWINNNLAFEREDLRLTTSETNLIEGVGPLGYLYGTRNPDAGLVFDGHQITIGGMPDDGSENISDGDSSENVSDDDGSGANANTFEVIAAEDSGGAFEYEFTADGPVEYVTDAGTRSAEVNNDIIADNGDGTYTVSGVTGSGYGDAYQIQGDITEFTATTDATNYTLKWNGTSVNADELQPHTANTLEVIAAEDSGGAFEYEFTADGPVEYVTDAGTRSAEVNNDIIADNGDGTYTVSGVTGSGYGDAYQIQGDITEFTATTDATNYTLKWNGTSVSEAAVDWGPANTLEISTEEDSSHAFAYRFTTDSPIEYATDKGELSAEANTDAITDNGDGTYTVFGATGNGYGDTYRISGEVTGFVATTDATNYTLKWNGSTMSEEELVDT